MSKIALFDPPVKIKEGVAEMSVYFEVVTNMTEPLVSQAAQ